MPPKKARAAWRVDDKLQQCRNRYIEAAGSETRLPEGAADASAGEESLGTMAPDKFEEVCSAVLTSGGG